MKYYKNILDEKLLMELGNSPPNKYSEIITKHLSKLFFNKVNNIKLKKKI